MRQMFTNQKGFSLLEVLIAISIFAVGLLALAQMQITSIQGNAFSGRTTDATTLAQDRLEQLMALAYTDADLDDGAHEDTQTVEGVTYTISWNVTDNALINNTKTVIMTVAWSDGGRQRTLSMQFIKAQAG